MIRIAFTGPESSGKSSLCEFAAKRLQAPHCSEYARSFLDQQDGKYQQADLLHLAKEQFRRISDDNVKGDLFLIDTELLVIKIWSLEIYGNCDPEILKLIEKQQIDLYVLCTPDIPWEPDPLRVNPSDRMRLFERYKEELEFYQFPYIIVSGSMEDRFQQVHTEIQKRFH